jgi:hypothetical protein|tara:strand:+ start:21771 stop:22928 length:1158 start_codon:yes stop_codon:yes gene_type:complete
MTQKILAIFLLANILFIKTNANAQNNLLANDKNLNNNFFQPKISSRLISEIKHSNNYRSSNNNSKYNDTSAKIRQYSNFYFNNKFFIKTYIKGQKYHSKYDKQNNKNKYFDNFALFFEELNINYKINENIQIKAGKVNLKFGRAWQWQRGISSNYLAKNYKQTEKIAIATNYSYGSEQLNGRYKFNFAAFQDDEKFLNNSIITKRNNKSQYLDSGLKSYLISLDIDFDFGEKYNQNEYLTYHFAFLNNSFKDVVLDSRINKQKSYAFNINYKLPIYQNINIDSLYEFVSIKNYHLQKNFKEKYHHLSNIISFYNNYNITFSKSWLLNSKISQKYRESLMEISTGYNFKNGRYFNNLLLQAGYQKIKEQQEYKDSFLVLIRYIKNF